MYSARSADTILVFSGVFIFESSKLWGTTNLYSFENNVHFLLKSIYVNKEDRCRLQRCALLKSQRCAWVRIEKAQDCMCTKTLQENVEIYHNN